MVIRLVHDFSCPWCWIGLFQAKRLHEEFGADFDWIGHELNPEGMEINFGTPTIEPPDKPEVPTRMQLAYAAQGMERPTNRGPVDIRTHKALEAVEYKKTEGAPDDLIEAIYRAYYEDAADFDKLEVLTEIARPHVKNLDAMIHAVETNQFADKIIPFDEPSYQVGVYNVPTFYIGEERYAEQPYVVLQKAMREAMVKA